MASKREHSDGFSPTHQPPGHSRTPPGGTDRRGGTPVGVFQAPGSRATPVGEKPTAQRHFLANRPPPRPRPRRPGRPPVPPGRHLLADTTASDLARRPTLATPQRHFLANSPAFERSPREPGGTSSGTFSASPPWRCSSTAVAKGASSCPTPAVASTRDAPVDGARDSLYALVDPTKDPNGLRISGSLMCSSAARKEGLWTGSRTAVHVPRRGGNGRAMLRDRPGRTGFP